MDRRDGFLGMLEAAQRANVALGTLRRRVRSGQIPVYADPRDGRAKLIKPADLDAAFGAPYRIDPERDSGHSAGVAA